MTTPPTPKDPGFKAEDDHWVRTLYERYVQLYGDPIEQPITTTKTDDESTEEPQHPNATRPDAVTSGENNNP